MKESIRHLFMAQSLLALGVAIVSCGARASSEVELAQREAELRGEGELSAGAAVREDSADDPASECDCGPLISWPPPECPRARWFCNAVGHCACDQPSSSATLETAAVRGLDSAGDFTASEPERSEPEAGSATARAIRPIAPGAADALLLDEGDDPECKCLGATVSPPQGGCALEDWYCNASGLCRCRS